MKQAFKVGEKVWLVEYSNKTYKCKECKCEIRNEVTYIVSPGVVTSVDHIEEVTTTQTKKGTKKDKYENYTYFVKGKKWNTDIIHYHQRENEKYKYIHNNEEDAKKEAKMINKSRTNR